MKHLVFQTLMSVALSTGCCFALQAQSLTPAAGTHTEQQAPAAKVVAEPQAPVEHNAAAPALQKGAKAPAKQQAVPRDLTPEEQAELAREQKSPTREGTLRAIQRQVTAEPGSRAALKQEYALVKERLDALQAVRDEFSEPTTEESLLKEHLATLMEKLDQ